MEDMNCVRYAMLAVLLTAFAGGGPSAWAKKDVSIGVESATNRDGSALKVRTVDDENKQTRQITIRFRPAHKSQMRTVARFKRSLADGPQAGATDIIDWDKDGNHEVSMTEECGAGPNCEGQIFRLNPKTGALIPFFTGNTFNVELIGGYLVESGRNNCCSWIYDFYKISPDHRTVDSTPAFSGYVGSPPESRDPANDEIICYFYKEGVAGKEVRISPPSKAAQSICKHYHQ